MDLTIKEAQATVTIFYSKKTGIINNVATGSQDFTMFGENAEDMKIIYDKLLVPNDNNIINNVKNYKVDLTTKQLVNVVTTLDEKKMQDMQNVINQQSKAIAEMSALIVKGGVSNV